MSLYSARADLTVIIPFYNAEHTLEACISSVLAQTVLPQELLLVNDGSSDNSCLLAQRLCKQLPGARLLIQRNRGVSSARNVGLKAARCRWVLFLDADDSLHPVAIETLMQFADVNIDAVGGGVYTGKPAQRNGINMFLNADGHEALLRAVLSRPTRCLTTHGWLLRTERLRQEPALYFSEDLCFGEDGEWLLRVLLRTRKTVLLDRPVYHYVIRRNSTLHRWRGGLAERYLPTLEAVRKTVLSVEKTENILLEQALQLYILQHLLLILTHDVFHPANPLSVRLALQEARRLCASEPYASALEATSFQGATFSVRVILRCLHAGCMGLAWLMVKIRQLQNYWHGLERGEH